MYIHSVKAAYFSPTGTVKSIVQGIAAGFNPSGFDSIDITTPVGRIEALTVCDSDLLIMGVPVYMGRVPELLSGWMNMIRATNTPAVCVVVYGNRAYENALLELKHLVKHSGCIPIAGAAFIGEHSFSSPELPTAHGRPDGEDLNLAARFGIQIRNKLDCVSSIADLTDIHVPGTYPYGGITKLWDVDFIAVNDMCIQCGTCAAKCPAGAIEPEKRLGISKEKCITCCACIKSCPEKARAMKPSPVLDAARRLNSLYKERKDPELFV